VHLFHFYATFVFLQPADVIEQLESNEFHELDPGVKLQVLVGLCHRIMASYSIQDFMDEKQQEAAELW
jgi:bromodomain adjacent to zinc finger domain protein 1B